LESIQPADVIAAKAGAHPVMTECPASRGARPPRRGTI